MVRPFVSCLAIFGPRSFWIWVCRRQLTFFCVASKHNIVLECKKFPMLLLIGCDIYDLVNNGLVGWTELIKPHKGWKAFGRFVSYFKLVQIHFFILFLLSSPFSILELKSPLHWNRNLNISCSLVLLYSWVGHWILLIGCATIFSNHLKTLL